jgi:hypothetical protein
VVNKDRIPALWVELLKWLSLGGFPEAIIAGGAMRDLDNGRPIKDIDIFVSDKADVDVFRKLGDAVMAACFNPHIKATTTVSKDSVAYLEFFDENLVEVFTFKAEGSPQDIQIIVLKDASDPWKVLDRMDFGLCQIGLKVTEANEPVIYATDAYVNDKSNRTFTLTRCDSRKQFERSMERFERLHQKYEHHVLMVPGEFYKYMPGQKA